MSAYLGRRLQPPSAGLRPRRSVVLAALTVHGVLLFAATQVDVDCPRASVPKNQLLELSLRTNGDSECTIVELACVPSLGSTPLPATGEPTEALPLAPAIPEPEAHIASASGTRSSDLLRESSPTPPAVDPRDAAIAAAPTETTTANAVSTSPVPEISEESVHEPVSAAEPPPVVPQIEASSVAAATAKPPVLRSVEVGISTGAGIANPKTSDSGSLEASSASPRHGGSSATQPAVAALSSGTGAPAGHRSTTAASPRQGAGRGSYRPAALRTNSTAPRFLARAAGRYAFRGTLDVLVELDANGTPRTARVVKSSGHALLDEAAERATMGFGYSPASTAGINEAARVIVPFVF